MFFIYPTEEQHQYAEYLVNNYNFGQRGYGDGNKKMQKVGVLGQICMADLLKMERPDGALGFDGGFDFVINGKKVDIKTMGRTVDMKEHYVHNFVAYQFKYYCEYYIFMSYNYNNNKMSICGLVSKKLFEEKAVLYKLGDIRTRDDGTTFATRTPMYEIFQRDLLTINSLEDIYKLIV